MVCMLSNALLIAIDEIVGQLDEKATVEEKLRKAMSLALNHWLLSSESDQINVAIGAVMLKVSDEDKELLRQELAFHRRVTAATALPFVAVDQLIVESDKPEKWHGLSKIWGEVKRQNKI